MILQHFSMPILTFSRKDFIMTTTNTESQLLELTRRMIDLKLEKKNYNAEMNEQIKAIEAEIKRMVK